MISSPNGPRQRLATASGRTFPSAAKCVVRALLALWLMGGMGVHPAAAQTYRFLIHADPATLIANGISTTTITVEVNQTAGTPINPGDTVRFVTTLGVIGDNVPLVNGVARTTLQAGTVAGVATITAIIGVAREQTDVEFLPAGAGTARVARTISLAGDYLAFSVERNAITGSGRSTIDFGDIEVTSTVKLDFSVNEERFIAEGAAGENSVIITNGTTTVRGDQLAYDIRRRTGVMIKISPDPARLMVSGPNLVTTKDQTRDQSLWLPVPQDGTQTWITARRIVIFPHEKIQFHSASVYVNDVHVLSLPIHVMPLTGHRRKGLQGIFGDRAVGYNSTGGVSLDIPFYYRASPSGAGAIRLRKASDNGFDSNQAGWSLALEEQYSLGQRGEGTFLIDQFPRNKWGLSLQHEQDFSGRSRGFFYLDFPRHQDLFSRASIYREYDNYNFGLELYGTKYKGSDPTATSQAYWESRPRMLGTAGWSYTTSANLGLDYNSLVANRGVVSQGVTTRLYAPALRLTSGMSLHTNLEADVYHDSTNLFNTGLGGTATLRQGLGRLGSMSVGVTYDPGMASFANSAATKYLTSTLYASNGDHWFLSIYGTRNLDGSSLFASSNFSYRLAALWTFWFDTSYQDFVGTTYTDYDLAVGRDIGTLEARLVYSKSRGKLYMEFGTSQY